ncbi:MAG: D-alanyl-D-alanine carboxypeptidase [Alphaproteobacteria bacterium]|nr:D-alanyl-D-alanine carboxypeptidase [Alphaproteobacteria bacterium]
MFRKAAFILLFLGSVLGTGNVQASTSSIMVNADNGKIMYESNADAVRYPASLTKLMTLYITFNALENGHLKLSDKLKVSKVAAGRSPSKLGVRAGETISVDDAIKAVIVKSANDCATVLAEHFSKSEAEFAVLMTKTAKKLGMNHTIFKNASGLPNSQQKTTARDMSKLAMAVYHHFPQYYKLFAMKSFKYKGQTITGHNHLLDTFSGADGMKTGYTAASGYNIITSAKRNGKRVIAVTMGHKYLNERDKKAALMMDKGLIELKKSKNIDIAGLREAIDGKPTAVAYAKNETKLAAKVKNIAVASGNIKSEPVQTKIVSNGKYALQVGAFSDYKRAKNYALSIKNSLAKKYAVYNIKVEKVQTGSGTMYRSKVVGMAKNTANQICSNMKRQKKNCLVVADNTSLNLAQK